MRLPPLCKQTDLSTRTWPPLHSEQLWEGGRVLPMGDTSPLVPQNSNPCSPLFCLQLTSRAIREEVIITAKDRWERGPGPGAQASPSCCPAQVGTLPPQAERGQGRLCRIWRGQKEAPPPAQRLRARLSRACPTLPCLLFTQPLPSRHPRHPHVSLASLFFKPPGQNFSPPSPKRVVMVSAAIIAITVTRSGGPRPSPHLAARLTSQTFCFRN